MTIDGEPVCELDIRASFITIFHAQRGRPLQRDRDPYDLLSGGGSEARDVVKAFIAATFGNSEMPTKWSAERVREFREETGKKLGQRYPIPLVRAAVAEAYPLLAALNAATISLPYGGP